ncbi:uncharacterized protein [Battus philenor]|uniref:uncharacterized protein n=1 Tax=Battus philenor TaxID=42288 RepID=UPI0035D139CE
MSSNNLPVIIVSAADNAAADKIISDLVDNPVADNSKEAGSERVWRLQNKYYEADVRLLPCPDGPADALPAVTADAHVIYLTESEGERTAGARVERAAGSLRRGAVRLALLDATQPTEAMLTWGLRARYEVVALHEAAEPGEAGLERARAALHAHVWPGLRRSGAGACPLDDEDSSEGEGVDQDEEGEEERAVERAEAFAEALGVLAALAGELRAEPHDDLRRARAEQLVAAFCRTLERDARARRA